MGDAKGRVLVIDDDPDFVDILKIILEKDGYEIEVASDPQSGFQKAVDTKPNIILLDVMFYAETLGFEYCRRFKNGADTKDIPVIMITSVGDVYGVDFWPADPDMLPADDYIAKPVNKTDLLDRVDRLIKRASGEK
ncbi:MAG TPA: response regulator [bacterium]|nr:response regulator [bacterium]